MIPANQSFRTAEHRGIRLDVELRLVDNLELTLCKAAVEIVLHAEAALLPEPQLLVVDHEVVQDVSAHHAACGPGPVEELLGGEALLPGGGTHAEPDVGVLGIR